MRAAPAISSLHTMTTSLTREQHEQPSLARELEQSIREVLRIATNFRQAGQLKEATEMYRAILEIQPHHAEANHHLGLFAIRSGEMHVALPFLEAAIKTKPDEAGYWLSYIDALIQSDQIQLACKVMDLGRRHGLQGEPVEIMAMRLDMFAQAVRPVTSPGNKEGAFDSTPSSPLQTDGMLAQSSEDQLDHGQDSSVVSDSGKSVRKGTAGKKIGPAPSQQEVIAVMALLNRGQKGEAEKRARALIKRFPKHGFGWRILGTVLYQRNSFKEALPCMQNAAMYLPDDHVAHGNLGIILNNLGRPLEAEASLRRALLLKPDYVMPYNSLGVILKNAGRLAEAEAVLRRAVALKPDYVEAHTNLGSTLKEMKRLPESESCLRHAVSLKPDFFQAYNNLGCTLRTLVRPAEAETAFRQALSIKPDYFEANINLGCTLMDQGRLEEAAVSLRRARELRPDMLMSHTNLLFCLSQFDGIDPEALFAEHCRFGDYFEAPLRPSWPEHTVSRDPDRCLNVGFVSGDFNNHAVASFIEPLLEHLAGKETVSLHGYYSQHTVDDVTRRLRKHMAYWHPMAEVNDEDMAKQVQAHGIDILIDLSGHTGHNRLLAFARKPAPIQVSWIGYPGTTGLRAMDYYFTDRFYLPPGEFDDFFTEKLVHLPANAAILPSPSASAVNVLPALNNGFITFGSFNRPSKISKDVVALWARLLRALPNAHMLLGAMPVDGKYGALIDWFAQEGIAKERLSFHPRCGMPDYLALHHRVDICLDTFPYAGGTTTFHAVWMGVPTLTLAGNTVAARQGACIPGHMGLENFIAFDQEDFVQKGLAAASDIPALAALRAGMRARFEQSPLGQPEVVADGLENAFRTMWRRWCAGQSPVSFQVM